MRIDKYICDTINITRSEARRIVSSGRVFADGVRICSPSRQVDEKTCTVTVDGQALKYSKFVYIMMNKPKGVLSVSSDKNCVTALDLLSEGDRRSDLFIAGRLDKDTTGFLLITNDGNFAHDILSPKKHISKTYEVSLAHGDFAGYKEAFESGITLEDGYVCKPAEFIPLGGCKCVLKISEGKFHQIKRMFKSLGNQVLELRRTAMGDVKLDKTLALGEYRHIEREEYELFLNKMNKNTAKKI